MTVGLPAGIIQIRAGAVPADTPSPAGQAGVIQHPKDLLTGVIHLPAGLQAGAILRLVDLQAEVTRVPQDRVAEVILLPQGRVEVQGLREAVLHPDRAVEEDKKRLTVKKELS